MNDTLFAKTPNNRLIGMPDGGELGSMALNVSINGSRFTLIYRARDESFFSNRHSSLSMGRQMSIFDGSNQQIARGIVGFAKQYDCDYALLLGNNCWVAEAKGISIAAQFEDDAEFKDYQLVVVPLDEMIYVAEIEDGLVGIERVFPIDRALKYLRDERDTKGDADGIAILRGGMAAKSLQDEGFVVNHQHEIFITGRSAENYRYQSLNTLLLKHRFYHHRLLVPASGITAFLLAIVLLLSYYSNTDTKVIVEQKIEALQQAVVEVKPDLLNNHAAQMLRKARSSLLSPGFDFLSTCRLTSITMDTSSLTYQGQWMDNLELDKEGCGDQRLVTVAQQSQQLQLLQSESGWSIRGVEQSIEVDSIPRIATQQALYQLDLLADYIGWQISIQSMDSDGENRDIQLLLSGDQLTAFVIDYLIVHFSALPARMQQGWLQYDPNSLSLINAEFYITLFTVGEIRS